VRVAKRLGNSTKLFSIKTIPRSVVTAELESIESELGTLLELDSPFIVKFHEAYYDSDYFHMVIEHVPGGDLSQRMQKAVHGRFDEKYAVRVIK
jgi:serine/threonine protein kinase